MNLLSFTEKGIYCAAGDFYIDPWKPVERAVITHAHSDHARPGSTAYLCHPLTKPILLLRLGDVSVQTLEWGETLFLHGVKLSLHPAGHIPGSSQVRVEYENQVWVVSGDYKTEPDGISGEMEAVRCDVFVTESTFGLPIFEWKPQQEIFYSIQNWILSNQQKGDNSVLIAYSLGKAQRLIALLRQTGYEKPIYVHGALDSMNALYQAHGVALGALLPATDSARKSLPGEIVIAPPSAIADKWARRFADPIPAFASGWMMVRARARQRYVELPLVVSDHADWDELTLTVGELKPEEFWITHGNEDALLRWAELNNVAATALEIAGYEDEEE